MWLSSGESIKHEGQTPAPFNWRKEKGKWVEGGMPVPHMTHAPLQPGKEG